MKVWLVCDVYDHYPYNILPESIRIFSTYEKMYSYLNAFYDKEISDPHERWEVCSLYENTPDWETWKKSTIEGHYDEYTQWMEIELE